MRKALPLTVLALSISPLPAAAVDLPNEIAAPGEVLVATVQAVGSQLYECRFDTAGNLVWHFLEPIATLVVDGRTVGRHYAGPHWEMNDGSVVSATVAARAPAASADDIPLLKLAVASRRGDGALSNVTTIQRINTSGGVASGPCQQDGGFLNVPYTADYAFYRKHN
jgi:hypothetical protein